MQTKDDLNASLLQAFPDSKVDLWDQNIVNGEYVIDYELDFSLHPDLQNMLPKVYFIYRLNSGIFTIFELSELNFNMNSSDCRAWKIISNDT